MQVRADSLAAILAGDRRRAVAAVDGARTDGMDLPALYLGVFQPSLREVGRLWQEDRIAVADEHLATAITQSAMSRLYGELFAARPGPRPLLVAACADPSGTRWACAWCAT